MELDFAHCRLGSKVWKGISQIDAHSVKCSVDTLVAHVRWTLHMAENEAARRGRAMLVRITACRTEQRSVTRTRDSY